MATQREKDRIVREYVREHDDSDNLDPQELDRMFHMAFGRKPDAQDRREGLWSHICAAVGPV